MSVRYVALARRAKPSPRTEQAWQAVHRVARAREAAVRRVFAHASAIARRALDFGALDEALSNRASDPAALDRAAAYVTGLLDAPLRTGLERALTDTVLAAGKAQSRSELRAAAGPRTPVAGRFDVTNPLAVKWIRDRAAQSVKKILDQTRLGIRAALAASFERGIPTARVARTIRAMLGLDERQSDAVRNLADMIDENPGGKVWAGNVPIRVPAAGLSDEQLDARLTRYAAKLLNDRANSIARTETIAAANFGQQETWRQNAASGLLDAGLVERVWIKTKDTKVCPICDALNGSTARIGGTFHSEDVGDISGPPAHPRCRCAQGLVRAELPRAAGDRPGHEFHGNQYTDGLGGADLISEAKAEFPAVLEGVKVGGLNVRGGPIPNTSSIESDMTTLSGVRVVSMDAVRPEGGWGGYKGYGYAAADDVARVERLVEQIKASGEITPLIVVVDKDGPYVLEGGHRAAALAALGIKEFPALVAVTEDAKLRAAGDRPGHEFHGNQWTSVASTLFDAARAMDAAAGPTEVERVRKTVSRGISASANARRESLQGGAQARPVDAFPGRVDVWRAFLQAGTVDEVGELEQRLVKGVDVAAAERLRHLSGPGSKKEKT